MNDESIAYETGYERGFRDGKQLKRTELIYSVRLSLEKEFRKFLELEDMLKYNRMQGFDARVVIKDQEKVLETIQKILR